MKLTIAENLRHFLGDLSDEDMPVYAFDEGSSGYYEVVEAHEKSGAVVLVLGEYHHALPTAPSDEEPESPE